MQLRRKSALVTGAASGIGRATALRFATEGALVACADIDAEGAQDTSAQITEAGKESLAIRIDVADEDSVKTALGDCIDELGSLDILFNNAGIGGGDSWDETIGINLSGVYHGLLHGAQIMAERGGGSIINTASILGLLAPTPRPNTSNSVLGEPPRATAYVASKHGVIGLTRSFAVRYGHEGVRVNAICPGYIETPMTASIRDTNEGLSHLESLHPIGRLGLPEEVASAAVFLASDNASFITGVALPVDGGYTAR